MSEERTDKGMSSRTLVLQSGELSHFESALRIVRNRFPQAELVGLVRDPCLDDLATRHPTVTFHPMPSPADGSSWNRFAPAEACVIPFDDRFGVWHWTYRTVPISAKIATVFSCNRNGRLRQYSLLGWWIDSVWACGVLRVGVLGWRAVLWVFRRLWWRIRRILSILSVFLLGGVALCLHVLDKAAFHPVRAMWSSRLPRDRKRVALFIPSLGLGGAQRQLATFLEYVDRSQWEAEVITVDTIDKFFEPLILQKGISVTRLNPHWQLYELGLLVQLVRHCYRRPCHVLHGWLHFAAAIGAIAGRLVGVQTVVGSLRSEAPGRFPWFYPPWQRPIDILTAPLHSRMIVNSNAVLRESREWAFLPDRKLVTIYNGIPCEQPPRAREEQTAALRRELQLARNCPVVGIVGRLSPEKDHATFLKAAKQVHQARPDARFMIVGGGPLLESIKGDIAQLGLQAEVRVLGGRTDTETLLSMMDVLVLTSTSEGLPNVLLEAAVAGAAIVTTAAGGAVEVVKDGETGFVVPCGDADAVADRVVALIDNPGLRARFVAAGRERIRTVFAPDRVAESVQACYAQAS